MSYRTADENSAEAGNRKPREGVLGSIVPNPTS